MAGRPLAGGDEMVQSIVRAARESVRPLAGVPIVFTEEDGVLVGRATIEVGYQMKPGTNREAAERDIRRLIENWRPS